MITFNDDQLATLKRIIKADSFAGLTFRRHNIDTEDERSSVLISWRETDRAGKTEHKYHELWSSDGGAFGACDYRKDGAKVKDLYGHVPSPFLQPLVKSMKKGDVLFVDVTLTDQYGQTEVDVRRNRKTRSGEVKSETTYRAITDVGGPNSHHFCG